MIINSTNINKTNNHLSMNTKKTMTYDIGNPGFGLGHVQKFGMVKPVIGIQLSSLDNWISTGNTYSQTCL
jgi:hypothetical protein